MNHQCNKERELDLILTEIEDIKKFGIETNADVKQLLKFKWQVMAIVSCISVIASGIFSILVALIN